MKELFGQRLREQRIKHRLTLEQLAEKSELSSNYIGMVERGLKEPGLATIVKLLNALNISASCSSVNPCFIRCSRSLCPKSSFIAQPHPIVFFTLHRIPVKRINIHNRKR